MGEKNKFSSYKHYLTYLTNHGDVESDMIEKFIETGLLIKEKQVTVDGYEAIGFRVMTEREFNGSKMKRNDVFSRVERWLIGDK